MKYIMNYTIAENQKDLDKHIIRTDNTSFPQFYKEECYEDGRGFYRVKYVEVPKDEVINKIKSTIALLEKDIEEIEKMG